MEKVFRCDDNTAIVETTKGKLKGYEYDGMSIFKGVDYARAKRFHRPEEIEPWDGVKDATSYGYVCPIDLSAKPSGELNVPHRYWVMNEDCQNLNIWTPGCDDRKRPVMVWLHGGGYEMGSAIEQVAYEGENMCKLGVVVVVSVNHRLNVLGYLDLSDFGAEYEDSGNNGTNDLIMALKWIQENIASFGGDPANVVLFGQSGGGSKVTTLLQTPAADGLYAKGINMSGVIGAMLADGHGSGGEIVEAVMAELGISDVKELEQVPHAQLLAAHGKCKPALMMQGKYVGGSGPQVNEFYLGEPVENGFRPETAEIPLMVGSVFGEFTSFGPGITDRKSMPEEAQRAMVEKMLGEELAASLLPKFKEAYPERPVVDLTKLDFIFRAPEQQYITKRAEVSDSCYAYLFNQDFSIDGGRCPWHCSDIPFIFHNTELVPVAQMEGVTDKLEGQIFDAVMAFAKTGDPSNASIPKWKACTPTEQYVMTFDEDTKLRCNHDQELIPVMAEKMGPIFMKMMMESMGDIQH